MKSVSGKKSRGHRTLKSLNLGKAIVLAICPIICLFYYVARALMYDVACKFACAVRMHRNK